MVAIHDSAGRRPLFKTQRGGGTGEGVIGAETCIPNTIERHRNVNRQFRVCRADLSRPPDPQATSSSPRLITNL